MTCSFTSLKMYNRKNVKGKGNTWVDEVLPIIGKAMFHKGFTDKLEKVSETRDVRMYLKAR